MRTLVELVFVLFATFLALWVVSALTGCGGPEFTQISESLSIPIDGGSDVASDANLEDTATPDAVGNEDSLDVRQSDTSTSEDAGTLVDSMVSDAPSCGRYPSLDLGCVQYIDAATPHAFDCTSPPVGCAHYQGSQYCCP